MADNEVIVGAQTIPLVLVDKTKVVVPSNPAPAGTVLLLHSNTTNGSTTFTDSSASVHTPSVVSGAIQHSTSQAKFGTSSIYFDGTSDEYLLYNPSSDFVFSTGDFTIAFWFYPTVAEFRLPFVSIRDNPSNEAQWHLSYNWAGPNQTLTFGTETTNPLNGSSPLTLNSWNHFAVTRESGTFYMFVNGVLDISNTPGGHDFNISDDLGIGRDGTYDGSGGMFPSPNGYMDELIIVKGSALWNSGFTPPTLAYT